MRNKAALMAAIVLIGLGAWPLGGAFAQADPWDREALEGFLDSIIAEHMAESHIPGAVLVLVKDGEIAFSKGYGYADVENRVPVDAGTTVFQAMSVSKLFTATAIMQLVEQGKIDLHADVNQYLSGYQVPTAFDQPVTIAHLLTHTGGLDYDLDQIGCCAASYEGLMPLSDYLNAVQPRRIWPPGERRGYSNAAMTILGLAVEEVSGQPFADYVADHILEPLGMARTSFRQPSPHQTDVARHYTWNGDAYERLESTIPRDAPAAAISGTGVDMAAFMIAHLQKGAYGSARILQETTVDQMHATHFTYHPSLPGQAYGFVEGLTEGRPRAIFHEGYDDRRLCSLMWLVPEANAGFFAVQNADDGCGMIYDVRDGFMERFFPRTASLAAPTPPEGFGARAGDYAGVYRFNQYVHSTPAKLLSLEWQELPRVTAPGDGTLELFFRDDPDQEPFKYVETGPGVFTMVNHPEAGQRQLLFLSDDAGRITGFTFDSQFVFERVPWYGRTSLHKVLFLLFAAFFVITAVVGAVALWRRREGRGALAVAALYGLLNALALAGLFAALNLDREQMRLTLGAEFNPLPAVAITGLFLLTSILAVAAVLLAVRLWRRRTWRAPARALYSGFALLALAFIPMLSYWNLLGFRW